MTQAVNAAESEVKAVIDETITAALSVIPTNVREQKSAEYKYAIRRLQDAFEEGTKANSNYSNSYNVLLERLRTNPTPEARSALVGHVKKWAAYLVGQKKSEVVSQFSTKVVEQSTEAHKKQEKLQERREPGGNNGSPAQRATLQQMLTNPKTSYNDGFDAWFNALARRR